MINDPKADAVSALHDLFMVIPQFYRHHSTNGALWRSLSYVAKNSIATLFSDRQAKPVEFGPFGDLIFPYIEMGSINSLHLFGLDELILFSFYNTNRTRYKKVVDFGTNIGLHTTVLSRCGLEVRSFEPDPVHINILESTLANNNIKADLHRTAISINNGEMEFIRVLGNTTGSHLAGAKATPYGELERFTVKVEAALPHLQWADLAKIDIEGHEAALLTALPPEIWLSTDAAMEICTAANAEKIYNHLAPTSVNMFSQKIGWNKVRSIADMPNSHRDGSLFLTRKSEMPWEQ